MFQYMRITVTAASLFDINLLYLYYHHTFQCLCNQSAFTALNNGMDQVDCIVLVLNFMILSK